MHDSSRSLFYPPATRPPYRLQLLLLLDQELQHQVDICQVQVLLVRIQGILEYLPPRTILDIRGAAIKVAMPPETHTFERVSGNVLYSQDGPTSAASPPTFASVSESVRLLWGRRRWKRWREKNQQKEM